MAQKEIQRLPQSETIPDFKIDRKEIFTNTSQELMSMRMDMQEFLSRQSEYLVQWDNYIESPVVPSFNGGANIHIPITMVMARAIHARFHAAMFDIRPWFVVTPTEKMDKETVMHVDKFMQWVLTDYINYYRGIEEVADDWLWDITTVGWGVLKRLWDRTYENRMTRKERFELEETLINVSRETKTTADAERNVREVLKLVKTFDGPVVESIAHEDFLMPGRFNRVSDLNEPHHIAHMVEFDAHSLRVKAKQGIFFEDCVEKLIKFKAGRHLSGSGAEIEAQKLKEEQDRNQGIRGVQRQAGPDTYILAESYRRFDINNDGYDEDCILWTSEDTRELVGYNFVSRVYPSGRRPFHKGDFIKRPRRSCSIGIVELLYPSNSEIDSLHNQRIDFGTLQTAPFFFYRPSGMKAERITIEAGVGIPLDDPQRDVFFPRPPNSVGFQSNEEQLMISFAERLASINDIGLGRVPSPVGGTRTVGGTAQLLEQANMQLNVLIKRWQKTWGEFLKGLQEDLSYKAPKNLKFRVLGSDGKALMGEDGRIVEGFADPLQLKANVDFSFLANANNINRAKEETDAITTKQILLQQAELQLGIITPRNLYNLNKNILEKRGQGAMVDDYLTKPEDVQRPFELIEEIASIIQGKVPGVVLNDQHEGKIQGLELYFSSPEFLEMASRTDENGRPEMVNPQWKEKLQLTIQLHQQALSTIQSIQQQSGNVAGAPGFQPPQSPQGAESQPVDDQEQNGGGGDGSAE